MQKLVQLIRNSTAVLVLDGNLTDSSIEIIKSIRNEDCQIVHNNFKPYSEYKLEIIPRSEKHFETFYLDIKTQLELGLNVWSHISTLDDQARIIKRLVDDHVLEALQIGYLCG